MIFAEECFDFLEGEPLMSGAFFVFLGFSSGSIVGGGDHEEEDFREVSHYINVAKFAKHIVRYFFVSSRLPAASCRGRQQALLFF